MPYDVRIDIDCIPEAVRWEKEFEDSTKEELMETVRALAKSLDTIWRKSLADQMGPIVRDLIDLADRAEREGFPKLAGKVRDAAENWTEEVVYVPTQKVRG